MKSDSELIVQLKVENANLKQDNVALTQEIIQLNALKRVKSEKYKQKIIRFLKKENKTTTSEVAELLGVAPGNASRVLRIMMSEGSIFKARRGIYKLKKEKKCLY